MDDTPDDYDIRILSRSYMPYRKDVHSTCLFRQNLLEF